MQPSGFSTGAISLGAFRVALDCLAHSSADAIELSALRLSELQPLVEALATLDIDRYRYKSLHAPSSFSAEEESSVISLLSRAAALEFYVIVHPDSMHSRDDWGVLGAWLCIENMDKRKGVGRTVEELTGFFEDLPLAGLCFDIAHARQVDGSMTEAYRILRSFRGRIRQVHISEVSSSSRHTRISSAAIADYKEVAYLIPPDAAIIVEAPVKSEEIEGELTASRQALTRSASRRITPHMAV